MEKASKEKKEHYLNEQCAKLLELHKILDLYILDRDQ